MQQNKRVGLSQSHPCDCKMYTYSKYFDGEPFKGALYVIEPPMRNSKIWPTREEAAPSVPKNILLNFNQTGHAPLFSNLLQMFPQLHCPGSLLKAMS